MASKNPLIKRDGLSVLDTAILKRMPNLSQNELANVRRQLIRFISKGLRENNGIALLKPISEDEFKLKIFTIQGRKK